MTSFLSYEIAAIFLLAALLMYGTAGGFAPRLRVGLGSLIGAAILLIGWCAYEYGPDLIRPFTRDDPAPRLERATPPHGDLPAMTTRPSPPPHRRPPPAVAEAPEEPEVVRVPPTTSPAPQPVPPAQQTYDPNRPDPFDSGLKRGMKRVGRFLHLTHRAQ